MYAQLGNIRFEGLKGFSSFSHERGVNYAQHERINGKPRLQAVGELLDTISFEMYLHADFTDPETDIETLNVAMRNREILLLILGNGKIVGDFIIPSMSQVNSFTDPFGNLISATISIELLESFNDNPLREDERQAISNAFATTLRNSNVRSVLPPKLSNGMGMTIDISKIETSAKLVNQYTASAAAVPSRTNYYSGKINSELSNIEGNISSVQSKLSEAQDLQDLAVSLPTALNNLNTSVQNMKAVLPISNIDNFKILNGQLNNSVLGVKTANVDVSNQSIIRRV